MNADAMLDRGDLDGFSVWKRILRAVEELSQRDRRQRVQYIKIIGFIP